MVFLLSNGHGGGWCWDLRKVHGGGADPLT